MLVQKMDEEDGITLSDTGIGGGIPTNFTNTETNTTNDTDTNTETNTTETDT